MGRAVTKHAPPLGGDNLSLQGMCVKSLHADYGDNFLPHGVMPRSSRLQRRGPTVVSITGGSKGPSSTKVEVFQFQIGVGARLITQDPEDGENVPGENVIAVIDAEFAVTYVLADGKAEPTDDALNEFASTNVPFNIWPYWRELLQSTSMRMGLPPIVLPLRQIKTAPKSGLVKARK